MEKKMEKKIDTADVLATVCDAYEQKLEPMSAEDAVKLLHNKIKEIDTAVIKEAETVDISFCWGIIVGAINSSSPDNFRNSVSFSHEFRDDVQAAAAKFALEKLGYKVSIKKFVPECKAHIIGISW